MTPRSTAQFNATGESKVIENTGGRYFLKESISGEIAIVDTVAESLLVLETTADAHDKIAFSHVSGSDMGGKIAISLFSKIYVVSLKNLGLIGIIQAPAYVSHLQLLQYDSTDTLWSAQIATYVIASSDNSLISSKIGLGNTIEAPQTFAMPKPISTFEAYYYQQSIKKILRPTKTSEIYVDVELEGSANPQHLVLKQGTPAPLAAKPSPPPTPFDRYP